MISPRPSRYRISAISGTATWRAKANENMAWISSGDRTRASKESCVIRRASAWESRAAISVRAQRAPPVPASLQPTRSGPMAICSDLLGTFGFSGELGSQVSGDDVARLLVPSRDCCAVAGLTVRNRQPCNSRGRRPQPCNTRGDRPPRSPLPNRGGGPTAARCRSSPA